LTGSRRRLPRSFFARPATVVAKDLLGRTFVRILSDGKRLAARIVETEAYEEDDAASHSYKRQTARNEVMFGKPGLLYVYFTYGMHYCMNLVTGRDGEGSAVLLRAAEPLESLPSMRRRRKQTGEHLLCSGPARFCEAFGIGRRENGTDLAESRAIFLEVGTSVARGHIRVAPRVGIREATEKPWRFFVKNDRFVSPGRRGVSRPSKR